MALRGDRKITDGTDISFFMNETGTRGEILVFSAGGSGAAMDDSTAVVKTPVIGSGERIAGLLLNDMVNLDLTRTHINQHKDEVQQGGKVTLLRHGVVVTNVIDTGTAGVPTIGAPAYLGLGAITAGGTSEGWVSATKVTDTDEGDEVYRVGTFLSTKDSDGYAKLEVNIA